MIAWTLWFFLALHLFLLDGWLAGWGSWVPDLALCVALFCALYARTAALPGLLVCAAVSRSVLVEGGAALHLLVIGIPVAVLLPLRVVFSKDSLLWPCIASGFLCFIVPRIASFLFRVSGDGASVPVASGVQILVAMGLVPIFTFVLRSLPPLSMFAEGRE